ncbi:MAG: ankyrin repeat domain-containing protein [Verrucomicrobiales bacterium]
MKTASLLFRTLLLALFTLSLLTGAIATDYYLRHETTRKAMRFLAERGIELIPGSAIRAAGEGAIEVLENLEMAGISPGQPDERGRTPLLAAIQSGETPVVDFLMGREEVLETINVTTNPERENPIVLALRNRDFSLADRLREAGANLDVDKEAGMPFLVDAVRSRDREMFEYLLGGNADMEYRSAQPTTALAVAADLDDLGLMRQLVKAGADPDVRGLSGKPLLIEAVKEGSRRKFDLLLDHGADVDAKTGRTTGAPMSALSFAVERGDAEMQEILLERGAATDVFSTTGLPLIYDVVSTGDLETTRRLLAHDASVDILTASADSPLRAAVGNEDLEMVDLLLGHGAKPSFSGEEIDPPLLVAVANGNVAIAHQLIAAGADLDGGALLAASYEKRDDPLMSLLLHAGIDPESTVPGTDDRVFDKAVHDGATGAVRTLLAAGAEIGDNLWAALLTGQDDLIRLILDAGADPRQVGPDGEEPLHYCLTRRRYKAASLLLDGGANPNAKYDENESWLTKSIREGDEAVALALLEGGAEVEGIKASDGHTLLGWAIAHQMKATVAALLQAGADPNSQERSPASTDFREHFDSTTFSYHLQVDRRITPIMMAAAQRNHEIAQILMDAGANGRAYTPRYLMAAVIGSWYKDARMQQIALLGGVPRTQPRKVVIDISSQRATLYENGVATYSTRCSTGKSGYGTPTGEYVISDRHRHHNSSIYGSSMPYFQRFSFSAFGLHEGYVPNYPASHGCIRVPHNAARHLFGKLEVGDLAVIQH